MSEALEHERTKERLQSEGIRHFLGPVRDFLDDETVSEVLINGPHDVYVERRGRLEKTEASFESHHALQAAVTNIAQFVGRHLGDNAVRLDARLPDGSRVHVVLPPCSRGGATMAIRKFSREVFDLARLVEFGSLTPSAKEFLEICVGIRKNIIVSGGTGTGKTSFLNALSRAIPEHERIIVIEDTSELKLQQPHLVQLEARLPDHRGRGGVGIRDLFISTLRLRPDRIVVGEVRAGEALDMLQAMTSGHPGSMSTLHADRPTDAMRRLETMSMMGDMDLPHHAVRAQVASAVDVIVQLIRLGDGRRITSEISEVLSTEDGSGYSFRPIYRLDHTGDAPALEPVGTTPTFADLVTLLGFEDRVSESRSVWTEAESNG